MTLCEPHNSNYYGGIRCPRQKIPPNSSLAQKECASSMRIFSPIIVFHAVKLILCHRTTEESRIHDDSSNRSFTQHMNPNMQLIKKTFFSLWTNSIIWCQFSFFPCMCCSTWNLDLSTHIWIYLIHFSKLSWLLKVWKHEIWITERKLNAVVLKAGPTMTITIKKTTQNTVDS